MTRDPDMPGVDQVDPELVAELRAAIAAHGPGYEPRTHHLEDDGSPTYVNRLIREASPYLLQHAHNPVNWFPWGEEAFERSRRENKPIFLSVGYSTCHWCHVMERESFEDEEIARYLNEHFVPIKVDREERPDVDDLYMTAVQLMTGRGGWPMTVVMTPDREPFFGGTYFPPRRGARGARMGLIDILQRLAAGYRDEPEQVLAQARELSARIRSLSEPAPAGDVPGTAPLIDAARQQLSSFDSTHGGFGRAPKFPQPSRLLFLARHARRTGNAQARRAVHETLTKMHAGGMYDHVGGGFHRYSTDAQWLVPHFEKMLYDNAQLVIAYLEGYQLTGDEALLDVAQETLAYVDREMSDPLGGFYSATDADSDTPEGHQEEGWFFTWTPAEIESVVGAQRARWISLRFGVTEAGNFEGRNIFHLGRPVEDVARETNSSNEEVRRGLSAARELLYAERATRPPPLTDDKVLASWNGLMIAAFARAASVSGQQSHARRAARAADFVLRTMRRDGLLRRAYRAGEARQPAFLTDYATLISGLIELFQATGEARWLREAIGLQEVLDESFWDEENGGYYQSAAATHEALIARNKPLHDGAIPSGNSIAALNLMRLSTLTGEVSYRERAERTFAGAAATLESRPPALSLMLTALDWLRDAPIEVVVIAPDGSSAADLRGVLQTTYVPNGVSLVTTESNAGQLVSLVPWLDQKPALEGRATAYVCERGRCELPTSDPDAFREQLSRVRQPLR